MIRAHDAVEAACWDEPSDLLSEFLHLRELRRRWLLDSGLLEHQRRAAHAAALEAPDREIETDCRRTVVALADRPVEAGEVARADALLGPGHARRGH